MLSDFRFAFRSLLKTPGFTAVAVLTLALGMGANTTFFSVLYGVVLRSLPFPQPGELVAVTNAGQALGGNDGRVSLAELRDYRSCQRSFVGLGAYVVGRATLNLADGAERVIRQRVTANFLPLLGVTPALGRGFDESEERVGHDLVIIVSHEFWRAHLGGTRDALGQTVRFNGVAHTVVGVMPAGFSFGEAGTAFWQPVDFTSRGEADRTERYLPVIARLAPGVSLRDATADLGRVAHQLRSDLPQSYPAVDKWSLGVTNLREGQFGHLSARLGALMAAAAAVLLIACVNVAIMFLLRAAARRREIMIRLSLGAGRRHIVRQLLSESAIVCALGAAGGLLIAVFGLQMLKAFPPADIPRLQEVTLNGPVAAFMAGVLMLVTVLVGLVPAIAVLKTRVTGSLTQSARTTESRATVRLRETLTVIEIALAVMLLVCGGLAFRSLLGLLRDDVGFTTARLFTFKTNLTEQAYGTAERTNRFYDQLTARLEALPGVAAVASVSSLPLSGESQVVSAIPLQGAAPAPTASPPLVAWRAVRGPYFSTMGSTLRRGRFFHASDQSTAPLVVMVDDEFARRHWPDEATALGQAVRFGAGKNAETRTIVGIIRRVKHFGPGKDSLPEAYVPQAQVYQRGMFTVVKATGDAAALTSLVRARLAEVDPTVPMYFVETMERRYESVLALPRFTAGLIGAFSALALVLAGVGIFGVMAYSVGQRTREFGIRFALGAQRSHVAALVLGRVGRLTLIGGTLGAVAAFQVAGLMASILFGVEPVDILALTAAAIVIGVTALLASLVPLNRALRVHPVEALRAE